MTTPAPESRRVALANGLAYHVLDWAPESGASSPLTFVLVHGFSDLAHAWQPVAERLAAHGRVVAPDLRGHGDSDWVGPGGYYHFLDYVADLDEVIARCTGDDRLVLVGHSMGGAVSAYWAGTRPGKLGALVLIEGLGPPDQSSADVAARMGSWIDAWRGARGKARVMASLDEAAERLRRYDTQLDPAEARRLAEVGTRAIEGGGGSVAWKLDPLHHTMGPYPFRLDVAESFWRRVACPVLCIDGADSRMNLADDERARRRAVFADCRHAVVAGAGHAVPRHAPAEVARLIVDHAAST